MISIGMARKRSWVGFVFWLGLVTAVLVVFVFSRPTIERVLESTDFFAAVRPGNGSSVVVQRPSGQPSNRYVNRSRTPDPAETIDPAQQPAAPRPARVEQPEPPVPQRTARVFFVMVDEAGEIRLHGVQRTVSADAAPLTATLRELLAGPTDAEQRLDLISLLPEDVELHRVSVQDGTAIIDLGQGFRFSSLGQEALLGRLKQLVYSATDLPTVDAVQVLIDGTNVDYLGPEGIYIGEPLTRDSLER